MPFSSAWAGLDLIQAHDHGSTRRGPDDRKEIAPIEDGEIPLDRASPLGRLLKVSLGGLEVPYSNVLTDLLDHLFDPDLALPGIVNSWCVHSTPIGDDHDDGPLVIVIFSDLSAKLPRPGGFLGRWSPPARFRDGLARVGTFADTRTRNRLVVGRVVRGGRVNGVVVH